VAADPDRKVIEEYDVALPGHETYANRTSYVIAPDGTILYVFTDMNPSRHVENTLQAITTWKNGKK
jgi:peroxiredoxin (alkyl hydroperoxide reductase subunit C)